MSYLNIDFIMMMSSLLPFNMALVWIFLTIAQKAYDRNQGDEIDDGRS